MSRLTRGVFLFVFTLLVCATPGAGAVYGQTAAVRDEFFFLYRPEQAVQTGGFQKSGMPSVTAEAAIVMDAGTGRVLYAKNQHQPRPIASTTKIMTALLAIKCGHLKETVTVSPRAAGVEGSSIYLRAGEKLSLEELLYGALMRSGNDACVAVAEHIAGSEQAFVNLMNHTARLLELKNTHFCNSNGLPHREHFSSAYDMAVITRLALKNPEFNEIVASRGHVISGPKEPRLLGNTNKMLWRYQGADGVKTGTTNAAGRCLVSSATREGRRLIAVVLHSDNRYAESIKLLDYGFANFRNQTVARAGEALSSIKVRHGTQKIVPGVCLGDAVVTVPVDAGRSIEKVVMAEKVLEAPVRAGLPVGKLLILTDGKPAAETPLVTMEQVNRLPVHRLVFSIILDEINSFIRPV